MWQSKGEKDDTAQVCLWYLKKNWSSPIEYSSRQLCFTRGLSEELPEIFHKSARSEVDVDYLAPYNMQEFQELTMYRKLCEELTWTTWTTCPFSLLIRTSWAVPSSNLQKVPDDQDGNYEQDHSLSLSRIPRIIFCLSSTRIEERMKRSRTVPCTTRNRRMYCKRDRCLPRSYPRI